MKNLSRVFAYFFFFLMLGFVACKSSVTVVEPSTTSIVGKWKVSTLNNNGASTTNFKAFQDYKSTVWEFKSDKTLSVDGIAYGTYTITNSILSVNSKATGTFTISSSTMNWQDNDDKIEFIFTRQ